MNYLLTVARLALTAELMPITLGDIVDALTSLGGEAHYQDLTAHVLEHAEPPFPADPAASVRARLQERCSSYQAYLGQADLFDSEPGSGIWKFRTSVSSSLPNDNRLREESGEYVADEGSQQLKSHLVRERDQELVRQFKARLTDPRCEACDMSFAEFYGERAAGYIEAHHRIAIAASDEGRETKLSDLAALCSNCHRAIHRNYPMRVEELADILSRPDSFASEMKTVRAVRQSWKVAVEAAIHRLVEKYGSKEFSRQLLIDDELDSIAASVKSEGATPAQTLSRVLQELRDARVISFVENDGTYRLN